MSLKDVIIMVVQEGKKKEYFHANLPNVRSLKGYLSGIWNFDIFNHCFPGKSKLSDVDGSIELNGHTLHIEFKGARNGMNRGQVLKAIRQAKHSNITTMFIFGKTDLPEGYSIIAPANNAEGFAVTGYIKADYDDVCERLKAWTEYTKKNSLITDRTTEWNAVTKYLGSLYQ